MTQVIFSSEDHASRAVRHQQMAAGYADQQMLDRDNGRAELAAFCQDKAESHAKQARFHLFRALDIEAEVQRRVEAAHAAHDERMQVRFAAYAAREAERGTRAGA